MENPENIRIDKFLWAARIYKTRSQASEECRKGRVLINNIAVKPSRTVSSGEVIIVKKPPVVFTYKVVEPSEKRVSAKLVSSLIADLTSGEEKMKLDLRNVAGIIYREKGTGRPTKKERRLIDRLHDDIDENL
ncbi:MAG TPA: S4 domain-containing protein [Bacteroidales bacterium]|nr:S4 domain-containing protein [Bacteroidales bacterium]